MTIYTKTMIVDSLANFETLLAHSQQVQNLPAIEYYQSQIDLYRLWLAEF